MNIKKLSLLLLAALALCASVAGCSMFAKDAVPEIHKLLIRVECPKDDMKTLPEVLLS